MTDKIKKFILQAEELLSAGIYGDIFAALDFIDGDEENGYNFNLHVKLDKFGQIPKTVIAIKETDEGDLPKNMAWVFYEGEVPEGWKVVEMPGGIVCQKQDS